MRSITIFILGLLISCDPVDDKLMVKNSTKQKIYFMESSYRDLPKMYDKTVRLQGKNLNYRNFINEVDSETTQQVLITGGGKAWERYINKGCEDEKLRIYTFNIDTLEKYKWEKVMKDNLYLKRGEFSVDDLNKQGWIIDLSMLD